MLFRADRIKERGLGVQGTERPAFYELGLFELLSKGYSWPRKINDEDKYNIDDRRLLMITDMARSIARKRIGLFFMNLNVPAAITVIGNSRRMGVLVGLNEPRPA